ncbi:hypothetical protein L873DRAFT_1787399 [Choiromyces venosus 120613-1]|uniref:Uncharacterized protein n=1 Tax=Choiromyces venosus 120613-1 TaxID=1336337 RepID=A0A3N4JX69_9PEZI|nr:hypothetical protein L873DRAFT_1787399 [Choiromyces venosus 120613-1]
MSEKHPGGEDNPDISGASLTEISVKNGDTPSHTLFPCYRLSSNPILPSHGLHSDENTGFVSTKGCSHRYAMAGAAKLSASGAGSSALVPLVEVKKENAKTSPSSEYDKDRFLLSDSSGMVGKTETNNGSQKLSLIDRMSSEEVDWIGYQFSVLIPTQKTKRDPGITKTGSESINHDSKLAGQAPQFEFENRFDGLNDVCDVAQLEPTKSPICTKPLVLGSDMKEYGFSSFKTDCHKLSLMDSCIVEEDLLIDEVEPQTIPSASQSRSTYDFVAQVPVPPTREEAERLEKNKSVFAWIDDVIFPAGHTPDNITPASPASNNVFDLGDTGLLVVGNSQSRSPSASVHPPSARNHSGISILDLDCDDSSPPVIHTTTRMSLNSSSSSGHLLLMDFGDASDPTPGGGPGPFVPRPGESPPSLNLSLPGSLTAATAPHLRDGTGYPSPRKGVERMRTVVKVVISAPKGVQAERKEARSPISGPIFSARTASRSEVGNAAWARWVQENEERASVSSPASSPPRRNPRSENTRSDISKVAKNGRGVVNPKNSKQVTGPYHKAGHTGARHRNDTAGSSSGNSSRAIYTGADLAAQTVVPVTWSGSGLPFEGLASRHGIDAPLGAMGYHNPKTVSYKRTSVLNRQQKIREQLGGTRDVAPPRSKVSPSSLIKEDLWESQEADFLRASKPAGPSEFTMY